MKRFVNYVLIMLFVGIIASCSESPSKMIIGTWKIDNIETTEEIPEEHKEMYKKMMDEMKKSSSFTFNEDGTLETKISEKNTTGKWSLNDDGKTLTVEEDNGKTNTSTIQEISSSKIVFTDESDKGAKTTITLVKQ